MNDKDDKQNDPMPDTRTPGNRSEKILVLFSRINKIKKILKYSETALTIFSLIKKTLATNYRKESFRYMLVKFKDFELFFFVVIN